MNSANKLLTELKMRSGLIFLYTSIMPSAESLKSVRLVTIEGVWSHRMFRLYNFLFSLYIFDTSFTPISKDSRWTIMLSRYASNSSNSCDMSSIPCILSVTKSNK